METKFNFNSQICTSKIQSERLLALGLKKETADCAIFLNGNNEFVQCSDYWGWKEQVNMFPAWSLHRLVEIGFHKGIGIVIANNAYDSIISLIEKRIKNGVFNKEYLNENI